MSVWWFLACPEPGAVAAQERPKTRFWADMRAACANRSFLVLVGVVFTLAMGFNFVSVFGNYISIFYLYGGDKHAARDLLGWSGLIWAITGLLAVFPLNWLSPRLGKKRTLGLSILLMIGAQLAKIICYNPAHPYLVIFPTVLLSAGMLMFFTLGSSMLGDVVDDTERRTGTRNEGSTYAVFWWFIKMGSAFASFVTGALIVFTHFDEKQTTGMDKISGHLNEAAVVLKDDRRPEPSEVPALLEKLRGTRNEAAALATHFATEAAVSPSRRNHCLTLAATLETLTAKLDALTAQPAALPSEAAMRALINDLRPLSRQAPEVLWRMRLTEIGLPTLLSLVSLILLRSYRLSEPRKAAPEGDQR
jgi:GPH family glycoside/pentoside/hexuronide:cation symporter